MKTFFIVIFLYKNSKNGKIFFLYMLKQIVKGVNSESSQTIAVENWPDIEDKNNS